ncbi:MAG TPA: HIRAN domain-containing protein [Thermodesulfovibrionia bacterium]|nr:HIRAN domain-containing protein [Thermodesulfovibrionia bacterium]
MKKLFLAWQDPKDRSWLPVGCLTVENDRYRFVYTQGAKHSVNFLPFARMKQLDTIYESKELFPLFANRLLSKSRSEYKDFLKWLDLNENEDDPLSLLALTEGIRSTDTLMVFPCPEKQADGTYHIHFFAHGIRYLPEEAIKLINHLQAGTQLYLMFDIQNTYDPSAIALRMENPIFIVGYCPRYITKDFSQLMKEQGSDEVKVLVERVNQDAPIQLRLLCNITGVWPVGFNSCSTELYKPLA